MSRNASGGMRRMCVADRHPDVAALLIARALAEVYRDALNQPVSERLATILRQVENWETRHGHDAA